MKDKIARASSTLFRKVQDPRSKADLISETFPKYFHNDYCVDLVGNASASALIVKPTS